MHLVMVFALALSACGTRYSIDIETATAACTANPSLRQGKAPGAACADND